MTTITNIKTTLEYQQLKKKPKMDTIAMNKATQKQQKHNVDEYNSNVKGKKKQQDHYDN